MDIKKIVERLLKLPKECEWAEFKLNLKTVEDVGEYISALSNGASLHNEFFGYLVYGIEDITLAVLGTTFAPKSHKVGKEELEHWLLQRTSPKIEVEIFEIKHEGKNLSIFKIQAAQQQPTAFLNVDYIRIGSIKRPLKDFPEKERKIWANGTKHIFEKGIVLTEKTSEEIIALLDTQFYFDLLQIPYPSTREAVIDKFCQEKFIRRINGEYSITNLGALLFAKDISTFETIQRKGVRVIVYHANNKLKTKAEYEGKFGYAVGFAGMVKFINDLLPKNEIIGEALRETVSMYPEIAIRELVANAIIHQDFDERGTGPIVEIFAERIEISNPGKPIISADRFIDECQSRNENLARMMRKFRICEERGSGIDKVVASLEAYQLPAYDVQLQERHTKVILYAYQSFANMDKQDRIRACYQHACLKYVMNEKMTNATLRERFKIAAENASMVSRIIKDTYEKGLIKEEDASNTSRKFVRYIPHWA